MTLKHRLARIPSLVPGVALCLVVAIAAYALQYCEELLLARAWIDALVLAILVGMILRSAWTPSQRWLPGISFSAKVLLEIAVVLIGASVSVSALVAFGPTLLLAIAGTVIAAIVFSFVIGWMLGLPKRTALLVACGTAICGNSAIAAVAPVIGADGDEIAASISFTAILGVGVVLGLPLIGIALHLDERQYGLLAGLTVYAVPQVIAAAAPIGLVAVQMGTLVKLVRVLMLGPVCVFLSFVASGLNKSPDKTLSGTDVSERPEGNRLSLHYLVPWFIVGFLMLVGLRALDLVPHVAAAPIANAATMLTIVSMAALGLGVDIGTIARAGGRVSACVVLSLLVLGGISFGLIWAITP
jgi:uncharacterized integral membrane protein (TIGR00698 family)